MNYQKIYDLLIEKSRNEFRIKNNGIYYESHHIIPKCLGGTGLTTQWRNHPNIVLLTAKEHFIAHLLLCEIYPENVKLLYALWAMCNQNKTGDRYILSSRTYQKLKELTSYIKSIEYKGRIAHNKGKPNPGTAAAKKGKKRPDVAERNRLRKGMPRPIDPNWISPLKGIKQNTDFILKRAESRKQNGKPIIQLLLDGTFFQEHRCISDATSWLKQYGSGKGDIRSNLYGKTKKAGGFIWKYKEN